MVEISAPRADKTQVESDHGYWALHKFAFDYDDKPLKFTNYHPGRVINDEPRPGYYDEYIPVAYDVPHGNVIGKSVSRETIVCPDCEEAARLTTKNEPVCPECGLICSQGEPTEEIIRDPKAAGRVTKGN